MRQIYIDFDSTLFDTGKLKAALNGLIAENLHETKIISLSDALEKILHLRKVEKLGYYQICERLEIEFGLEKSSLTKQIDDFLVHCSHLVYDDSVEFLKTLQDYQVNILTFSPKRDTEFQMRKMLGSGLLDFADNIIICSKPKGELKLDYENAIFVDDNPSQLSSLINAGVSENRLFRVKRDGAKYSNLEIVDFSPTEISSLKEIKL